MINVKHPMSNEMFLIEPSYLYPRVVSLKDLLVAQALPCQTIRSHLTHANTVTPAAPDKIKPNYTSIVVVATLDYKELFAQAKC